MLFRMAASLAHISSHVVRSRPQTSEFVSRRDPPILSILILHFLMDLVAAAQLSFPVVFEQIELQAKLLNYFLGSNKSNINQCTAASLLSNCSAHMTEMLPVLIPLHSPNLQARALCSTFDDSIFGHEQPTQTPEK